MSEQALQALWERIQNDADFRRKLHEAPTPEDKWQVVHSAGFDVGPDDLPALRKVAAGSNEELQKIASGIASGARPFFGRS